MSTSEQGKDSSLLRRRARRNPPSVALRLHLQTPEEERHFNAAFRLFLTEMARQILDRQKESI